MHKPAAIVGVIAILCLAEIFLLFSIAVPSTGDTFLPGSHQIVALIVSLLLIPGLAAIFLCLNYGLRGWQRRIFGIIGIATATPLAFIGLAWVVYELSRNMPEQQDRIDIGFFSVALLLVCWLIVVGWRTSRRRGVIIEAQHWLDERHSGVTRTEVAQRHRAVRRALWLPSLFVLLALLYLPETWALVSHMLHGGRYRLHGHVVSVPAMWVLLAGQDDRIIFGVVAPGFGRRSSQWLREGGIPISSWDFSVYQALPLRDEEHNQTIETRTFSASGGPITCVQYVPNWWGTVNGRYSRIDCSGPNGLSAHMEGETRDVPVFFGVISRIR